MSKRFVDYGGLERFWVRITQRYDKKLDSVTSSDDSIKVDSDRIISVRISPDEDNLLSVITKKENYIRISHHLRQMYSIPSEKKVSTWDI